MRRPIAKNDVPRPMRMPRVNESTEYAAMCLACACANLPHPPPPYVPTPEVRADTYCPLEYEARTAATMSTSASDYASSVVDLKAAVYNAIEGKFLQRCAPTALLTVTLDRQ